MNRGFLIRLRFLWGRTGQVRGAVIRVHGRARGWGAGVIGCAGGGSEGAGESLPSALVTSLLPSLLVGVKATLEGRHLKRENFHEASEGEDRSLGSERFTRMGEGEGR